MKQEKIKDSNSTGKSADEIDLLELLQTFWREKIFIFSAALVFVCAAIIYVPSEQTQYTAVMNLKPAPLSLYGDFIAEIENSKTQSITLGRYTSEQLLAVIKHNLIEYQALYFSDKNVLSFKVSSKSAHEVTLELSALQSTGAVKMLTDYLELVSEITLEEVNVFLSDVGIKSNITNEMLYSADKPVTSQFSLGARKKEMIVFIGAIIGAILGLFAALILRSMIRKRKEFKK